MSHISTDIIHETAMLSLKAEMGASKRYCPPQAIDDIMMRGALTCQLACPSGAIATDGCIALLIKKASTEWLNQGSAAAAVTVAMAAVKGKSTVD
jgi:hypothetical protein